MSKSKLWIAIVVVLLVVNTILLVFLWMGKRPRKMMGGSAKDYLTKELSLNEAQVKQYDQLRDEHIGAIRQLNDDMKDLKDNMFDNLSTNNIDSNKVKGLLQQIGENEKGRDSITFYHFRKLRTILTAEQQQKFDKIIKNVLRMMGPPPQAPPIRDRPGGGPPMGEPRPGDEPRPENGPRPGDTEPPSH
jgi:periplasmic protein CpxP/Spy